MNARASEWAPRVAAWRASGESAAAFCRREGLPASSFRYWAKRLEELSMSTSAALDEAVPERVATRLARVRRRAERASPGPLAPLRVVVSGAMVEVPVGFDDSTLRRVLDVLAARREA